MTLKEMVAKAAELRTKMAEQAPAVEAFKQTEFELKLLKADIMAQLTELGSSRSDYVEGLRATKIAGTPTLQINDTEAFYDFLEANAKDYRQYIKPDAKLALKFAKEYAAVAKKAPDGTEFKTTPYIKFDEEKIDLGALSLSESDNPLND
jgi:hypothetical protein